MRPPIAMTNESVLRLLGAEVLDRTADDGLGRERFSNQCDGCNTIATSLDAESMGATQAESRGTAPGKGSESGEAVSRQLNPSPEHKGVALSA